VRVQLTRLAARDLGKHCRPAEARYQIQRSFLRLRVPQIDLFQVHNMGDPPPQLALLKQLKAEGFIRYIGITTTFAAQYSALVDVMRSEPIDFIGIDYAVDNRTPEQVILIPSRASSASAYWSTFRSAGAGCRRASMTAHSQIGRRSSTRTRGRSSCLSS
jgi:aryl-alcohol dehydrogenase-like predicted oxidoreductase